MIVSCSISIILYLEKIEKLAAQLDNNIISFVSETIKTSYGSIFMIIGRSLPRLLNCGDGNINCIF